MVGASVASDLFASESKSLPRRPLARSLALRGHARQRALCPRRSRRIGVRSQLPSTPRPRRSPPSSFRRLAGLATAHLLRKAAAHTPDHAHLRIDVHLLEKVRPSGGSLHVDPRHRPLGLTDTTRSCLQNDSLGMDAASLSVKSDQGSSRVDVPMRSINGGPSRPRSPRSVVMLADLALRPSRFARPRQEAVRVPRRSARPLRLHLLVLPHRRPSSSSVSHIVRRKHPRHSSSSALSPSERIIDSAVDPAAAVLGP